MTLDHYGKLYVDVYRDGVKLSNLLPSGHLVRQADHYQGLRLTPPDAPYHLELGILGLEPDPVCDGWLVGTAELRAGGVALHAPRAFSVMGEASALPASVMHFVMPGSFKDFCGAVMSTVIYASFPRLQEKVCSCPAEGSVIMANALAIEALDCPVHGVGVAGRDYATLPWSMLVTGAPIHGRAPEGAADIGHCGGTVYMVTMRSGRYFQCGTCHDYAVYEWVGPKVGEAPRM